MEITPNLYLLSGYKKIQKLLLLYTNAFKGKIVSGAIFLAYLSKKVKKVK